MQDPAIGKEVDGYQILDVLGRGGMGVVYKAEDVALSRVVALKRIDPSLANDETFLRRFRSEARALARIDSPHIVSVHALRKTDLGLLIVMEYVDGGTLKDRILAEGAMDVNDALSIIQQMLAALEHAHGAGVIHRDIKPHNIMLTEAGRVKVTDFGLAKVHRPDDQKTVTQGVYGTLNYMSPEQVQGLGQVDQRSDIYSLGMTIYEMLAGRLPFDDDSSEFALMRTIVEEELPPPDRFRPDLPQLLVELVSKSLEKDPDQRFQSAAEMRRALRRIEKKLSRGGVRDEAQKDEAERMPGAATARKLQYAVLSVLVFVLGVGVYVAYHQLAGESTDGGATEDPLGSTLSVSTDPPNVSVSLNGQAIGSTPLSGVAVKGDSLDIRLEKSGYRTIDTTLYVADSRDPSLSLQLEPDEQPSPPTLSVSTEPAGVDVSLNGRTIGSTPLSDVTVTDGPLNLRLEKSGYRSIDTTLYLADDRDPLLSVQMERDELDPPARGTLSLNVEPGGTVLVNGEPRGSGRIELPPGRHTLRFRHPEYGNKDTTVTVAAGQTLPLTCYFEQTITVTQEGAWGNVWINGQNTGESAPQTFTRGPGTYRVELRIRREEYGVSGGKYSKLVGDRRYVSSFSRNDKQIIVEPTFTPTKHALFFRTTERPR